MSRVRYQTVAVCLSAFALACALPAWAQYPGRVNTGSEGSGPHLRATAVVEYTGTLAHMKQSRLIPIAVWDGMQFQPGGLYLAQPAPLAVLSGTQYELEQTGRPKGFFNVRTAESLAGLWIGVGRYEAPRVVTAKLQPAKVMPYRIKDVDPDKPHFAHRPAGEQQPQQQAQKTAAAPPVDPDRPTLHERPHSDTSAGAGNNPGEEDPDRPTFHREIEAPAKTAAAAAAPPVDPNRPRLEYTAPTEQEKLDRPDALVGLPAEMNQIVGVSDPKVVDTQAWTFSWSNPDDAAKMKADLEAVAEKALLPSPPAPAPATTKTAAGRRKSRAKEPVAPQAPLLADEQFRVFSLSFGGGATMVLSAQTSSNPVKYVTLIAQPDFYGKAQVLLTHVTGAGDLDVMPRMQLIDAVDPRGDGQADLLFELRGQTFRQFALYRIGEGQAIREFATQPSTN